MVKDSDCSINYHPPKDNVVANALSKKSSGYMACLITTQNHLLNELGRMGIQVVVHRQEDLLAYL